MVANGQTDYIPMTDHHAVIGHIILKPPHHFHACCLHDMQTPVLNTPHIKFPYSSDKHLYQVFRDQVNIKIVKTNLLDLPIADEQSFLHKYKLITDIINDTAVEAFGRVTRNHPNPHKDVTNPKIQELQALSCSLGGALCLKSHPSHIISYVAFVTHGHLCRSYIGKSALFPSLHSFVASKRSRVNKEIYKEQSSEAYGCAKKCNSSHITQALNGGSTKWLVHAAEFISLPMSINSADGSGKLLSTPSAVKEESHKYWKRLYDQQPIPVMDELWMSTLVRATL